MLETIRADNGSWVLQEQGRLLASAVDPEGEARDWVLRREAFLHKVKAVFVLGLGSGYHVAELVAVTSASLIVIEHNSEICSQVATRLHTFDRQRVHIENIQDPEWLKLSVHVKSAMQGSFLVLNYAPAVFAQKSFYTNCQNFLLGREWSSLAWQWKSRGFPPLSVARDSELKNQNPRQLLNIHDLNNCELVQNQTLRESMLIKALRELIK